MWKNKNTYKLIEIIRTVAVVSITGASTITIGSLIFENEKSERNKKIMKETKLQIPEFMKKKMNVKETEFNNGVKLYHGGDNEPEVVGMTAEQVAEKVGDYYSYVHECEECALEDNVKEESKEVYNFENKENSRPQEVEELSEPHKEKLIRYIKGMSVAEQILALECIPVELCMMRISKEISELKEFKSTINGAMSALEGKF